VITKTTGVGVDLYWLPLGAGGRFVRFNGRVYERLHASLERRPRRDLYHSALEVTVPEGRFVIENAWPIPNMDGTSRGVTVEGPVGNRHFGRFRVFRYEVRRWREGTIADIDQAVESPRRLSHDEDQVRHVLALAGSVPAHVWGRDELRLGEMWNSNSVISWLLTTAGLPAAEIHPPMGGRAPGWASGVIVAERMMQAFRRVTHRWTAPGAKSDFYQLLRDPPHVGFCWISRVERTDQTSTSRASVGFLLDFA
jgi:hypothetical protein